MKIAKQFIWAAPLGLLLAGCNTPQSDDPVAEWRAEGQLPPTGAQVQRVYAQPQAYPAADTPRVVVDPTRKEGASGDYALADTIRERFEYDRGLSPSLQRVTISVRDGRLTLRGTVKSDFDARNLVDSLRDIPGVVKVKNELEVNPNWY